MFLKSPDEDRKEAEIVSNKPEFNRSWVNKKNILIFFHI